MARRDRTRDAATPEDQTARFLRADPDLIAEVQSHAARIVRFKGYYVPETDRIEVVQEVMTQLWQAVAGKDLKLRESLFSLTETIACRRCVDWMRRHRSTEPLDAGHPDGRARPDEALLRKEREGLGRRVLQRMGAPCAELIRKVMDEGRAYTEIANEQGRSEHALRTKMWQCLKEAREILKRMTTHDAR
ncbi:MAG: sigma-70 family RNA polymerase sigma factor [Acidobacteria bacterium]|nr:sigma-70 family RNA polymerase sigma factor [Acidobacteriota bacterium]